MRDIGSHFHDIILTSSSTAALTLRSRVRPFLFCPLHTDITDTRLPINQTEYLLNAFSCAPHGFLISAITTRPTSNTACGKKVWKTSVAPQPYCTDVEYHSVTECHGHHAIVLTNIFNAYTTPNVIVSWGTLRRN
ncbi:hypothetical protein L218DRAFT_751674 [Marasmius fiardii PR-910]|nr:hypothetical protein L218DRAFT_751674 [Marasmius fiardii PR-910]